MLKLLLAAFALSFHLAEAQTYQTSPMGSFTAPASQLAQPDEEARNRLYFEGTMPLGRYKGLPMDFSERRPPVLLEASLETSEGHKVYSSDLLSEIPLAEGEVLVANVEHLGKFYVAVVNPKGVRNLDMAYSVFMPIASHYLTFFNFDENAPVRLVAELPSLEERIAGVGPKKLEREITLDALVLSIEATAAQGYTGYNLIRGGTSWFANTFLLTTVPSELKDFLGNNYPRRRYRSNFTQGEVQKILQEALHTADRSGNELEYHTLIRNCTSLAMEIYERAVGYASREETPLRKLKKYTNQLLGTILPLGKVYPLVNEFTGAVIRDFRDLNSQLVNLEDEPRYRRELERQKRELGISLDGPTHEDRQYGSIIERATNDALCKTLLLKL